jgi:electron transfer flavoprotein beta subunit
MRTVVCVKQVYDPRSIRVSRSREELDLREAVVVTNPADKYALEAALRLRDAVGGEVVALTLDGAPRQGQDAVGGEDAVREAIAIGADRGVVLTGSWQGDAGESGLRFPASSIVTRVIAAALGRLAPVDLALTGQAGLVDGTGSLAPRLAAALGWPVALDVLSLEPQGDGLVAVVSQPDSADCYRMPLALPAVAALGHGAERPRYPHPGRIANAWREGLVDVWDIADLGLAAEELTPDAEPAGLILGPERARGQTIGGAPAEAARDLVGLLRSRRLI